MDISREELQQLTTEYLKTKQIIRPKRRRKPKQKLTYEVGLVNVHLYGESYKVV
jgi:hypothetical protein